MNPSELIEEAQASIQEHTSYESPIPKFWDPASRHVEFGVRRRAPNAVLADIDAYTGAYPILQASIHKQSHAPVSVPEHNDLTRVYPEVIALTRDPEASVSLWLVSNNHMCVEYSRARALNRSTERERRSDKENGCRNTARQTQERNSTNGESDNLLPGSPAEQVKKGDPDKDPQPEPFRLDARALFKNLAFPQVIRVPYERLDRPGFCPVDTTERVIRIAVDFKPPGSKPLRRTGTVVQIVRNAIQRGQSETYKDRYTSSDGTWSVVWDDVRWFGGAWAWLGFADLGSGSEGPSHGWARPDESGGVIVLDSDGEEEAMRPDEPTLVLAWTCKNWPPPPPKPKPQPRPKGRGKGKGDAKSGAGGESAARGATTTTQPPEQPESYPEWYIVTMLSKRQVGWKSAQFIPEECNALGLGRTKREVQSEAESESPVRSLDWVESWSDSRFRPILPRDGA